MIASQLKLDKNPLFIHLQKPIPPLKTIRNILESIEPEEVSWIMETDKESIPAIEYYFQLFSPDIGGRIIGHADFSINNLVELSNHLLNRICHARAGDYTYKTFEDSLHDSYWIRMNKPKLQMFFPTLIRRGPLHIMFAFILMRNLDENDLFSIGKKQARVILDFFIDSDENFKTLLLNDLTLYNFIHKLARNIKEKKYLDFFEENKKIVENIMLAMEFSREARNFLNKNGKLPLKDVVEIIANVPNEHIELTMKMLVQKSYISEAVMTGILRLKTNA